MSDPDPAGAGAPILELTALKQALIAQIVGEMRRRGMSKTDLARRMGTSRVAIDRLLDGSQASVTLHTLGRAAAALDRRLRLELA